MVYRNNLVAAIKVNGKILRESDNTVTIPFGSEYTILIKNLNSVRVQVRVSIDGQDATSGTCLIIEPNRSLELERFIRNGNWESGNRFKFIERTAAIEEHKGVGAEDGLIRVEWKMEQVKIEQPVIVPRYYDDWYPIPRPYPSYPRPCPPRPWFSGRPGFTASNIAHRPTRAGGSAGSMLKVGRIPTRKMASATASRSLGKPQRREVERQRFNDTGITVPGSESNQRFVTGEWFKTVSQSEVLVLHLRGVVSGKAVEKAVTVDCKPECSTCGKTNKGGSKFCSQCGTVLQLV